MEEVRRVLVVDADPAALADSLAGRQATAGCQVALAASPPQAVALLRRESFPVLLVDLELRGALELLKYAVGSLPHTVTICLASEAAPARLIIEALKRGLYDCLPRENNGECLAEAVAAAFSEAARRRERDKHSLLIEQIGEGCFISQDGGLIYANQALAAMLERPRPALAGLSLLGLAQLSAASRQALERALAGQSDFGPEEVSLVQNGGGTLPVELHVKRVEFEGRPAAVGLCRDVSERKELAGKLSQAERLATMGSMISGIAHELNNKLAPVVACAELLESSQLGLKDRQRVQVITSSALEAKRIVEGLLNFARQETPRPRRFDLNAAVTRLLALPTYRFKQWGVEASCELAPDLPQTMADPDQIERVLINLVNNACQAMEGTGGRLRLLTRRQRERLVVEVEDSGPGIAPENLPRIFDPFFSTKGLGKGTGLGLSLCHGIVKQHGGEIEVESGAGRTAFRVLLPLVAPRGEQPPPRRPAPPLRRRPSGRLLLVDDEDNILRVLRDALGESFEIVCAANGREAVGQLARGAFDAVVTDIKMPHMDGMQLFGWIESNQPELARRVIFTTGNTIDAETGAFLKGRRNPYLTKPFNLSRLLATLENVLE